MNYQLTSPCANLGWGGVEAETVLGDFGGEIGVAPGHDDIIERAYAPRCVEAH